MARPKKLPGDLKTDTIAFRITPAERLRIEEAARRAGLGPSEYARAQTLRGRVVVQERQTLGHAAFDQLRRIGVNLNQLARIANQTQRVPAELTRACEAVEQFLLRELEPRSPAAARRASVKPAFSKAAQPEPSTAAPAQGPVAAGKPDLSHGP